MSTPSHIAIIGLGLIGGSLAKAIKSARPDITVSAGNRSEEPINLAIREGIIDDGSTHMEDAVKHADIVILCTPLCSFKAIAKTVIPHMKAGAVLSDAGSAKQYVIDEISPLLKAEQKPFFIPAHPIAGSEKTGISAADEALYQNRRVILTPPHGADADAIARLTALWELTGANIETMSAPHHDGIYASVSHVPQLLAFAYAELLNQLSDATRKNIEKNACEAFKRFMRISHSSLGVWQDIFTANNAAIRHWLDKTLDALREAAAFFNTHPADYAKTLSSLNVSEHNAAFDGTEPELLTKLHALPALLSRALHTVAEPHIHYAGTGFADFTSIAHIPLPAKDIVALQPEILKGLEELLGCVETVRKTLLS